MTTSQSTNFKITAEKCVRLALKISNVIGEGDYLEAYDTELATDLLNLLLKSWQHPRYKLWVRQTVSVFVQKNQAKYRLMTGSSDHATADDVIQTTLSDAALSGSSTIKVTDTSSFAVNDHIGIVLDSGYLFWSTVQSIPVSGTIIINNNLTGAAASGNYILGYTNLLSTPLLVYRGSRHDIGSNTDIPLTNLSYTEYFDYPVKSVTGTPVSWTSDRQVDYVDLYIWQPPTTIDCYIKLIISRKIQDIDVLTDDFDLPQEWHMALVYNLAALLCPAYGKADGNNFVAISAKAQELLSFALSSDSELGSVYFMPSDIRRP